MENLPDNTGVHTRVYKKYTHQKGYPPDNTGVSEGQYYVTQYCTTGVVAAVLQRDKG